MKKHFTVVGGRTLLELRGIRCLPLELLPPPKDSITCSRSFSETVSEYKFIHHALSCYLMTAIEKMRVHRLAARTLTVFVETNRFAAPANSYANSHANSYTFRSAYPSDNLFEIQSWATGSLEKIFREGFEYKKCGVILGGLLPGAAQTNRMYEPVDPKREKLNKAIDEINRKFGKGTIHLAAATIGKWQMKRNLMSPRYTTRIDEIIKVK